MALQRSPLPLIKGKCSIRKKRSVSSEFLKNSKFAIFKLSFVQIQGIITKLSRIFVSYYILSHKPDMGLFYKPIKSDANCIKNFFFVLHLYVTPTSCDDNYIIFSYLNACQTRL